MREIIKLGLILFIITAVAAVVLGLSNGITSEKIAEVEAAKSEAARKEVLSDAESFEAVELSGTSEEIIEAYKGLKGGEVVGFAIKTATSGYGGNVEVITGISSDGIIKAVKVVGHQETPGLGANSTSVEFQGQYSGKKVDNEITVVKTTPSNDNEIQAITGATITSNAVTKGVNLARELFNTGVSPDKVESANKEKIESAKKELFPDAESFEVMELDDASEGVIEAHKGLNGEEVLGYIIETGTEGYGGNIEIMTGISLEGKITGVKVINHKETPGVGDKAITSEFQAQYEGKKADSEIVSVKSSPSNDNEIQAVTGATVTSDAITKGVNVARELFNSGLNK